MNIFIDLGCYSGDTVEEFRNWSKIAFADKKDWQIYAFDPNPHFKEVWDVIKDDNTHFYNKAAWTDNCKLECAIENSNEPLGTSVMKGKLKTWDNTEEVIQVEAFDFSSFLKQFKGDFVVVKMDTEGAEFPVLEKMIADKTDKICDYLMVEFHPNKVVEYTTTDKNILIDKLKSRGVNILEWH